MSARRKRRTGGTFLIPFILAVVSVIGLVSALTGDGLRDAISWLALSILVAAILWAYARRA
ncbi:MAG TPA: hypothetical protein VMG08_15120 [Allosphingosinicella sp.]|nr:hypothetical protein [Allosphingosinicella sp.]